MQKRIKTVAYIRVATKEQLEVEPSIRLQREAIRDCCKQNGWELIHEYMDVGVSGIADERPEFQRVINMAQQPDRSFDIIIVDRYSRFSRKLHDIIAYTSTLKKAGIILYSVTEQATLGDPHGFLHEEIVGVISKAYRMDLKVKKRNRKQDG